MSKIQIEGSHDLDGDGEKNPFRVAVPLKYGAILVAAALALHYFGYVEVDSILRLLDTVASGG